MDGVVLFLEMLVVMLGGAHSSGYEVTLPPEPVVVEVVAPAVPVAAPVPTVAPPAPLPTATPTPVAVTDPPPEFWAAYRARLLASWGDRIPAMCHQVNTSGQTSVAAGLSAPSPTLDGLLGEWGIVRSDGVVLFAQRVAVGTLLPECQ